MPTYNVEQYVGKAIESILNQTYKDFDFIIIDDGSTDGTIPIIEKYAASDARIIFSQNPQNEGIIETRNKLFDLANHEFIAMMDSDDIAYKERFQKQIDFLEHNKEYGIVASNIRLIPMNSTANQSSFNNHLREKMIFENPINNPVAMFRSKPMKENKIYFDPKVRGASDYKFWVDLLCYTKGYILADTLLDYRCHNTQESTSNKSRQRNNHIKVTYQQLQKIDPSLELTSIEKLFNQKYILSDEKSELVQVLISLVEENKKKKIYDFSNFAIIVQEQIHKLLLNDINYTWSKVFLFFSLNNFLSHPFIILNIFKKMIFNKKDITKLPMYHALNLYKQIQKNNHTNISVYGTGEITEALQHYLEKDPQINIEKLFDIKAKQGIFHLNEAPVYEPSQITTLQSKVVIISSFKFKDEILGQLKDILKDQYKNYIFIVSKG